jgi:hypothetical protein
MSHSRSSGQLNTGYARTGSISSGSNFISALNQELTLIEQALQRLDMAIGGKPPMRFDSSYTSGDSVPAGTVVLTSGYLMHANKNTSTTAPASTSGSDDWDYLAH